MSIDKVKPEEWNEANKQLATERQVGGSHYKGKIQPIEYILAHNLNWMLGHGIKYITRCGKKGNKQDHIKDLLKVIHYMELELQHTYNVDPKGKPINGNNVDCEKIDWEIFLDKQYLFYYQQNVGEKILEYDDWLKENEKALLEEYNEYGKAF